MGTDQEGRCGFRAFYPGELGWWPRRILCRKAFDSTTWNLSSNAGDRGRDNRLLPGEPALTGARYRDFFGNSADYCRYKINLYALDDLTTPVRLNTFLRK